MPGAGPQEQREHVPESLERDIEDSLEDRRIGEEARAVLKRQVVEELETIVEEPLDDIPCTSYHNA